MTAHHALAAAVGNLGAAVACTAAVVWGLAAGESGWLVGTLATLGGANLLTAGLILRGEARR